MNKSELIAVRGPEPSDVNFILATWLRGLYYGNDWFHTIDKDAYFKHYNTVAKAILTRPGVIVKVACLKEDPEIILGYSVCEDDKLHWIHVKNEWRNIGLSKQLVPDTIKTVTHLTKVGKSLLFKKGLIFNPFII